MLRRENLYAIESEEELKIHRLLSPQRAVVVERGDSLGDRNEIRRALFGHLHDEVNDGLLSLAVVPGWEWILCRADGSRCKSHRAKQHDSNGIPDLCGAHDFVPYQRELEF